MNLTDLVNPSVLTQPVYEPGRPIEDVARELGLDPRTVIKLASNENSLGSSPLALEAARRALAEINLYPDGGSVALRKRLAERHGLAPEQFIVGNGSNEIIELLGHAFLGSRDEAVMGAPAFIVYKLVTLLFGARPVEVPLVEHRHDLDAMAAAVTPRTKLVFLPSPNNPTGTANSAAEITTFVRALPGHVIFVLDEAYAEYLEAPPDLRPLIAEGRKLICLRTFSKIHGLAGLRVGYGYASAELAGLLHRVRQPFNINAVALAAARAALDDDAWLDRCRRQNREGMAQLAAGLTALGCEYVPSEANFLLVRVGEGAGVAGALQRGGVIVRPLAPYHLRDWVRITVGTHEQNERALGGLGAVIRGLRE